MAHQSSPAVALMLSGCRSGNPPAYVRKLPVLGEEVPPPVRIFCSTIYAHRDVALRALLINGHNPVPATEETRPYLSGPLERQYLPVPAAARFFAHLYHHIAAHGGNDVTLCGSDLFHAHLFIDGDRDVGLLFHAKEHPKEFTLSSQKIHDVGSSAAGGQRDPRIGTQHSARAHGFSERNFFWLFSTNMLYLLLPHEPTFPTADLLSEFAGYQFATCCEAALSTLHSPVMDINYLNSPVATPHPLGQPCPQNVTCAVYAEDASSLLRMDAASTDVDAQGQLVSQPPPLGGCGATTFRLTFLQAAIRRNADASALTAHGIAAPLSAAGTAAAAHAPVRDAAAEVAEDVARACAAEAAEAVARVQRRTNQIDATLRFERLLGGRPSPSVVESGHWVVLVGGEFGGAMHQDEAKTRPGAWLGSHTSLQAIGRAFEALLPTVGRKRIIVIAQLAETLQWLESACESAEACERVTGSARFLHTLRGRLVDTRRECAVLIAHGGSDYDYRDVNPSTVLHVLGGDELATGAKPVVPARATSVFVLLYSHGNAHPRRVEQPDAGLDEHYIHFPHPVPPEAEGLYAGVAYAGDKNNDTDVPFGPKKFRWRLYATMLFQALLQSFQHHPGRQVVLLNQSCLSAGHARFLHHAPFVQHFGTQSWPILMVSTAGPYETSIADFWDAFLEEWSHAVAQPVERRTLGHIFRVAEAKYYALNRTLKEHNDIVRQMSSESADENALSSVHQQLHPLTFGTVHLHEGRGKDGGPMSETSVWDLLMEEAGSEEAVCTQQNGRSTPSPCVRCPHGHRIVTNEAVPGRSYPVIRNFGACDICDARGTTHRCAGGCDYDLCQYHYDLAAEAVGAAEDLPPP